MPDYVYSYDWYDGPRSGVASYEGLPYYFGSQWADVGDQLEDWFKLSAISNEAFEQELEQWALWKKYEVAFHAGLAGPEHHPFLPADQPRGQELKQLLEKQLVTDEASCLFARAIFSSLSQQEQQTSRAEMAVRWEVLPEPPSLSSNADFGL